MAKILEDAGEACGAFHYESVRGVKAKRVQCDEIWSFLHCKDKNVKAAKAAPFAAGSVWTWTAIDADSKLIVSYMVGDRDAETANYFMDDLRDRLDGRVQLTTDGLKVYLDAVAGAFGSEGADYAMLVKLYGDAAGSGPEKRYSPAVCTGAKKVPISGMPEKKHVSTSYVERQNLTMRNEHAPVHAADERLLEKDRQPYPRAVALLRVLQLRPSAQDTTHVASDGRWHQRPALEHGGHRGAD